MIFRILFLIITLILSQTTLTIERRNPEDRDDYTGEKEISYFFYPLIYTIPGIGSGEGLGATSVHLLGDDSTINVLQIRGDMEVDAIAATDMPLFTKHLTLSLLYADSREGGFAFYNRGSDSSEEPAFTLKFNHVYGWGADLALNFFDNQVELYSGYALAIPDVNLDESDLGGTITDLENRPPEEQDFD